MTISKKLLTIVFLTAIEVSVTMLAAFEMSKGSDFHQFNILHLKYSLEVTDHIYAIENGREIDVDSLRTSILNVRQQPVNCLSSVNALEKFVMQQIGTDYALDICAEDLAAADVVIAKLGEFESGALSQEEFLPELLKAEKVFRHSSDMFQKPIDETVSFIFKSAIPLILFISAFNILFIAYLSRSITKSISDVILMLKSDAGTHGVGANFGEGVSGEIRLLLDAAKQSIENEFLQRETNMKLDKLVQEKTDSLRKANQELVQFNYRASHDLKSPLVAISRLADCIEEDIDDKCFDEAVESVRKIKERSERLSTLIEDIANLSRADLVEEDVERIDVDAFLEKLRRDSLDHLDGHPVEVSCSNELGSELYSQPTRLAQILSNLVSNGIKYANREGVESYVAVKLTSRDGTPCIEVRDNGVGIPEEYHSKLYERFQRFHPNMATGSGLGLSIVKNNIDRLGASIEFTSSAAGTVYTLTLPRASYDESFEEARLCA